MLGDDAQHFAAGVSRRSDKEGRQCLRAIDPNGGVASRLSAAAAPSAVASSAPPSQSLDQYQSLSWSGDMDRVPLISSSCPVSLLLLSLVSAFSCRICGRTCPRRSRKPVAPEILGTSRPLILVFFVNTAKKRTDTQIHPTLALFWSFLHQQTISGEVACTKTDRDFLCVVPAYADIFREFPWL